MIERKILAFIEKIRLRGSVEAQEKALLEIVKRNENIALDLNISQLLAGENSDGSRIEPPYSVRTIEYKKAKNQPFDRVTTRDEGEFHQKFYLETDKFPVEFNSNSLKTGKLTDQYGPKLFGTNKENTREFVEEIKPEVEKYYDDLLAI